MDIQQLKSQYKGTKYGNIVLKHYKNMDINNTVLALNGTMDKLPAYVKNNIEGWIDEIQKSGSSSEFWINDASNNLEYITNFSKIYFNCDLSNEDLFNIFQVTTLSFSYGAHKNAGVRGFIQKSVGVGLLGRMFS